MILQVMNTRLYWDSFTTKVERKYFLDMVLLSLLSMSRLGTQLLVEELRPQDVLKEGAGFFPAGEEIRKGI